MKNVNLGSSYPFRKLGLLENKKSKNENKNEVGFLFELETKRRIDIFKQRLPRVHLITDVH